jgi:hypothetical protein
MGTGKDRLTEMNGERKMRIFRKRKAQSVVEYAIMFTVVVGGLASVGFISNARGVFQNHFDAAVSEMAGNTGSVTAADYSDTGSGQEKVSPDENYELDYGQMKKEVKDNVIKEINSEVPWYLRGRVRKKAKKEIDDIFDDFKENNPQDKDGLGDLIEDLENN